MPRLHRIVGAGVTYHIYSRGNNGEAVFIEDTDRHRYLRMLADAKARYVFQMFVYTLMTNHIHLVLQTTKPNISQVIWWMHGHYAKEFNQTHSRHGHLFATRFRSRVVEHNEDLLQVSAYIHLNPVRAGIVQRPEDYPWSSFRRYADEHLEDSLVDVGLIFELLANSPERARIAYVEFVHRALGAGKLTERPGGGNAGRPSRRNARSIVQTMFRKEGQSS